MISGANSIVAADCFSLFRGSRCPDLLRLYRPESAQHIVQFYEDELVIIENVAFLSANALDAGHSSVLIATEPHLQRIATRMTDFGINPDSIKESGRFVAVEAGQALSRFMVDGVPDETRFQDTIGEVLRSAETSSTTGFVFAFGEMVALLCEWNKPAAAVRLEQLWNSLAERHHFSLYCAYSLSCLGHQPSPSDLIQICSEHALTVPSETSL
jgi:MEDS: MEthanogen/methylotroph, DcmR Sensory domain